MKKIRMILVALILGVVSIAGVSPAHAISDILNPFEDCKEPAVVTGPTDTIAGEIDPPRNDKGTGTKYLDSGYAGLQYHTYDWGCVPKPAAAMAEMDTAVGNSGLQVASIIAAVASRAHKIASDPAEVLQPVDKAIGILTSTIKKALYTPWSALVIMIVAATVISLSLMGRLSDAISHAVWLLAAMALTVGIMSLPGEGLEVYDETVSAIVDDVDAGAAGMVGESFAGGIGDGHSSLIVEQALYRAWLRGTIGTVDPEADEKWGKPLWEAQRLTYAEAAKVRAGDNSVIEAKNEAWENIMSRMEDEAPQVYAAARGQRASRTVSGWWAVLDVMWMALFTGVADLFRAVCLIVMRCIIPVVAALGVIMLTKHAEQIAIKILMIFMACLINAILFGVAGTIHVVLIGNVFAYAPDVVSVIIKNITCFLITIVMFWICWPLLDLRKVAGIGADRPGLGILKRVASLAGTALAAKAGVKAAMPQGDDDDADDRPEPEPRPEARPVASLPAAPARHEITAAPARHEIAATHRPAEERQDGSYAAHAAPPPRTGERFSAGDDNSVRVVDPDGVATRHNVYSAKNKKVHRSAPETPHAHGKVVIWDPKTGKTEEIDV